MSEPERVNSRLTILSGAKPCVFSGKVAVYGRRWRVSVSAASRLDPESGQQNVDETVARARFHKKERKKLTACFTLFDHEVDKMRTGL